MKVVIILFCSILLTGLTGCEKKESKQSNASSSAVKTDKGVEQSTSKTKKNNSNDKTFEISKVKESGTEKKYKKPDEISNYVGFYKGVNNEKQTVTSNGVFYPGEMTLQVHDDGSYTAFLRQKGTTNGNRFAYFDSNNQLQRKEVDFDSGKFSTGVIVEKYGKLHLTQLYSMNSDVYLDSNGNLDLNRNLHEYKGHDYYEIDPKNEDEIKRRTIGDGMINSDGTMEIKEFVLEKTEEKNNLLNLSVPDIFDQAKNEIYSDVNDLFQRTSDNNANSISDYSDDNKALNDEQLDKVYTSNDKKIDARFGYTVNKNSNKVDVYVCSKNNEVYTIRIAENEPPYVVDKIDMNQFDGE